METTDLIWWSVAVGLGAVVLLVAVWLLEIFTREVERIENLTARIWLAGKQVAANTATTWMLDETSKSLADLEEELGRHAELLGVGSSEERS